MFLPLVGEKGFALCFLFASCLKKQKCSGSPQLIRAGNDPDVGFSPLNHHFSFNYVDTLNKQTETLARAEALKLQ